MYSCQHCCDGFLIQPPEDSGQEQTESNSISLGWKRETWHEPPAGQGRREGRGQGGSKDRADNSSRIMFLFFCFLLHRHGPNRALKLTFHLSKTNRRIGPGQWNWCWVALSQFLVSQLHFGSSLDWEFWLSNGEIYLTLTMKNWIIRVWQHPVNKLHFKQGPVVRHVVSMGTTRLEDQQFFNTLQIHVTHPYPHPYTSVPSSKLFSAQSF